MLITLFYTFIARRPAGYSPSLAQQPQTAETSATRGDRRAWDARALEERRYGAPLRVSLSAIGKGERANCIFLAGLYARTDRVS